MITKINLILLLVNTLIVLIVNCVNVRAFNQKIVNNFANSSELKIDKSQQHFPLMNSKSREVRGVFYGYPFEDHEQEYHEHETIVEPKYIIKVVAPPKRNRDAGVRELLLVLAPLAAIPLLGSAALTTFTAMFATSGYGKRRKRDLLTRELLSRSFTEVQPRADDYVSQRLIGNQHNVGLESLLATTHSTGSTGVHINPNAKRHPFPENDLIRTKIGTSFGSQTAAKSPLIGVKDQNNWTPIDTNGSVRTGGPKSTGIMSNTSHSLENKGYKSVESLVKGFRERFTQSMISSDQSLGKREKPHINAQTEHSAQVEPIEKQQYKSLLMSSAYLKRTDFRPDIIVKNNNTSDESISTKINSTKNGREKKYYQNFRDITDSDPTFPTDITAEGSEAIDKRIEPSITDSTKNDNKEERDQRFEYNTWIPFLSNPYLLDMARGEGKREIQELDVIQKYLNAMGRPDYNDEIIATYLSCNGMLSASNQCLERLTCQFSDTTSPMKQLEKEVSSLVIYSLLKNEHIDNSFKSRLQKAAFFGKDNPGKCNFYNCPKINVNKNKKRKR